MTKLSIYAACMAVLVLLSGCDSPEKKQFVSLCEGAGDTGQHCSCTYDAIKKDVGKIDAQFVMFAADFAKWGKEPGSPGLDRDQMMKKYDLNKDEYHALAGEVGSSMLKALASCKSE